MAMACSVLSEDQFQCSICLDVFTEPVSIPCGHNFCKACLTRHWEGKEQCKCPLCNEKFSKGLKLCVNTVFREVVENFTEHNVIASNYSPVKPGQVPCDCCLGNKFKASKTCLVCLASYCETHLEPHLRVPALKRHKLTNPVHNLEDQICKKHNRMLDLFCRNESVCVCVLCTEHSSHDIVPLEEAYVNKRFQMGKKKAEVQEMKHKRGKKAQKTKVSVQTKRKGKYEVLANNVGTNQKQGSLIWWIPHQFNSHGYYLGNRDFSEGRFYLEVQAEGITGLDIGESMRGTRTFIPNPSNKNWVIRLGTDTNCNALHEVPVHLFLIRKHERVVVFVDYDAGLVSFFDADTEILVFSISGFKFNESMYLLYSPSPTKKNSWAKRLQMGVQKIKEWSQLPDTEFILLCFCFVFVLVGCINIALSEQVLNHDKN